MDRYFVIDDESVGLHGEGFAVGYVLISAEDGVELGSGRLACYAGSAVGLPDGHDWVESNIPRRMAEPQINCRSPYELRSLELEGTPIRMSECPSTPGNIPGANPGQPGFLWWKLREG